MPLHDLPRDEQPQPEPQVPLAERSRPHLVEPPEDPLQLLRADPHALVLNRHVRACALPGHAHRHLPAVRRVLDRVLEQVHQHLLDPLAVRPDQHFRRRLYP